MNKYYFLLTLNGGYCEGHIVVEAKNQEEATTKAQDSFVTRWCEAYPELEVDYDVELDKVEIDQDEIKRKLEKARELCPGDEGLEINCPDGYEVYILRYKESRGSAESINGMGEDDLLWYQDDAEYDIHFDPQRYIDQVEYACI